MLPFAGGSEQEDGLGDVFGNGEAPRRCSISHGLANVVAEVGEVVLGDGEAGADDVDEEPGRPCLPLERGEEPVECGLRGRVALEIARSARVQADRSALRAGLGRRRPADCVCHEHVEPAECLEGFRLFRDESDGTRACDLRPATARSSPGSENLGRPSARDATKGSPRASRLRRHGRFGTKTCSVYGEEKAATAFQLIASPRCAPDPDGHGPVFAERGEMGARSTRSTSLTC
jgi:hypothetical protein